MSNLRGSQLRPRWRLAAEAAAAPELAAAIQTLARHELNHCSEPGKLRLYRSLLGRPQHVLAALLLQRGVDSPGAALDFLWPDLARLHSWRQLPDGPAAVARLQLARERGERVLIHGDYDADGITATALLVMALADWGLQTEYYLPHRQRDGYGLSQEGISWGADQGCSLLLTVDCGVSSHEAVDWAASLGLDVIITDHHLPPPRLPRALAVVNPKRADSEYPFAELAGAGVAWKLAAALVPAFATSPAGLQLAALGTVADLVPLVAENRILVTEGLKALNSDPLPGLAALATAAGYQPGHLDSQDIAFGLAPRLNAAGRMDSPEPAAALLLTADPATAAQLAAKLDADNRRRRQTEEDIFTEALSQAESQSALGRRMLVVHGPDWHAGVIGIVASKILERYYRPTIVFSGAGELTGSARSIEGFDIHAALTAAAQHVSSYGGHPGAAGLALPEANIVPFQESLERYAVGADIDSLLQPIINLEARLGPADITMELVDAVGLLRPFGFGNPEPCFRVEGFRAGALSLVGANKRHLRLRLENPKGQGLWAIGFGKAHLAHCLDVGETVAVAGLLHLNRWRGVTQVQLQFTDLKGPNRPDLAGRELIDRRGQGEPWLSELAGRPDAVFIANTRWRARRLLAAIDPQPRVIILHPDKGGEKVYNLEANEVCFLDPAWSRSQLSECINQLPRRCRLHFFGGDLAETVMLPNLSLLRSFYQRWKSSGDCADLLRFLPADLAEPLLLERALAIFHEAGLVRPVGANWRLEPSQGRVDLTRTGAWQKFSAQLAAYQKWLQGFGSQDLNDLLA